LATRNPDVTWSRKNNPEPNEAYRSAQYKVRKLKFGP
jgi:NADH-ubiquinone reductase complex 1 MLRQ subunit